MRYGSNQLPVGGRTKPFAGWRLFLGAGLLAGLLSLAACSPDSGRVRPAAGALLPAVELTGLTDEGTASTEALRGHALVINFWATWCAPCRSEMQSLEHLSRRLAAHGVRVIGVTVDRDLNLAREFVRSQKLTFSNYADGELQAFQSSLGVKVLPETVLVTAEGAIAARIAGAREWNGSEGRRLLERAFNLRLVSGF